MDLRLLNWVRVTELLDKELPLGDPKPLLEWLEDEDEDTEATKEEVQEWPPLPPLEVPCGKETPV